MANRHKATKDAPLVTFDQMLTAVDSINRGESAKGDLYGVIPYITKTTLLFVPGEDFVGIGMRSNVGTEFVAEMTKSQANELGIALVMHANPDGTDRLIKDILG